MALNFKITKSTELGYESLIMYIETLALQERSQVCIEFITKVKFDLKKFLQTQPISKYL